MAGIRQTAEAVGSVNGRHMITPLKRVLMRSAARAFGFCGSSINMPLLTELCAAPAGGQAARQGGAGGVEGCMAVFEWRALKGRRRAGPTGFIVTIGRWLAVVGLMAALSARAAEAKTESKTVVVLGDSLAAGFGLDPAEAFPALLQKKIDAAGWNYTVVNAGVSGDTSADGLGRINWLLRRKIDVLILELGANDGLRGIPV